MAATKERVRKSEKLTPELKKAFKEKVASFEVKVDAAEFFGVSTVTIDNIILRGSAKPATITTIKTKLGIAA